MTDTQPTITDEWVAKGMDAARDAAYPDPYEVHIAAALTAAAPLITAAERERCAQKADSWSKPSIVKLAAGEMTAGELRTAQAVARGIAAAIRTGSAS